MPAKGERKTCPHCGASMMEYRHTLSRALVEALARLVETGPVNLAELGLDRNAWDNFQKLRYWDLVRKHVGDDGRRVRGAWIATDLGTSFVKGEVRVPKAVRTYRGERTGYEGEEVSFSDLAPGWRKRADYGSDAVASMASADQRTFWT